MLIRNLYWKRLEFPLEKMLPDSSYKIIPGAMEIKIVKTSSVRLTSLAERISLNTLCGLFFLLAKNMSKHL